MVNERKSDGEGEWSGKMFCDTRDGDEGEEGRGGTLEAGEEKLGKGMGKRGGLKGEGKGEGR